MNRLPNVVLPGWFMFPNTRPVTFGSIAPGTGGCIALAKLAPVIVALSLDVGLKIVVTASLSFLGLGAQPPTADWGNMIASGRNYIRISTHMVLIPGFAIFLVALCLNIIGDQLRDILDPRQRS